VATLLSRSTLLTFESGLDCTPARDHTVESDCSSECQYAGGVDVNDTGTADSDYDAENDSSVSRGSDSVSELEGDDLEENLQTLATAVEAEVAQLARPTPFGHISI